MELEKRLAEILFGPEPLIAITHDTDEALKAVDRRQFELFYRRMVKRVEERLTQQFGACLALIEERLAIPSETVATRFLSSSEYRLVREDQPPSDAAGASEASHTSRFEIQFLNFVLRTSPAPDFEREFSDVFLAELVQNGR